MLGNAQRAEQPISAKGIYVLLIGTGEGDEGDSCMGGHMFILLIGPVVGYVLIYLWVSNMYATASTWYLVPDRWVARLKMVDS